MTRDPIEAQLAAHERRLAEAERKDEASAYQLDTITIRGEQLLIVRNNGGPPCNGRTFQDEVDAIAYRDYLRTMFESDP